MTRLDNGLYIDTVDGAAVLTGVTGETVRVIITAWDKNGFATDSNVITVTVNRPPTVRSGDGAPDATVIAADGTVDLDLAPYFTDPEGGALAFALYALVDGRKVSAASLDLAIVDGRLTGAVGNLFTEVIVAARDPHGPSASVHLSIVNVGADGFPTVVEDHDLTLTQAHFAPFDGNEPLESDIVIRAVTGGGFMLRRDDVSTREMVAKLEPMIAARNAMQHLKKGKGEYVDTDEATRRELFSGELIKFTLALAEFETLRDAYAARLGSHVVNGKSVEAWIDGVISAGHGFVRDVTGFDDYADWPAITFLDACRPMQAVFDALLRDETVQNDGDGQSVITLAVGDTVSVLDIWHGRVFPP